MVSWNIIQQSIGDKGAVKIRRAFIDRTKLTDIRTNWDLVENAISQGSNAVYNAINWAKWIPGEQVKDSYNEMYNRSKAYLQKYAVKKADIGIEISTESFRLANPEAEAWLLEWSAKEIVEITFQDRETIKAVLANGMRAQQTTRKTAKQLREVIGLNSRQTAALINYRKTLEASGKPPDKVDKMTARYRDKMLRYRAETIALTESHTATNEAWSDAVTQAVKEGAVSPKEYELYWLVAPDERLCPACAALAGVTSPPDVQDFGGNGKPPLHPRCRCTTVLRRIK